MSLSRTIILAFTVIACFGGRLAADDPLSVRNDALLRMPGTQPGQVTLEESKGCYACHGAGRGEWVRSAPDSKGRSDYREFEIFMAWQGSMMGNAARDFLFYACMTVSAQDSIWALGTPHAVDLCERCHFPKGWLEGRSDPPNASSMTGGDFDGVQCSFCHRLTDPFFRSTYSGHREGADWNGYWDEEDSPRVAPGSQSLTQAVRTLFADVETARSIRLFNGFPFFLGLDPASRFYTESGGGQYYLSPAPGMRGPFADAVDNGPGGDRHPRIYSRFHKSKYFCSVCHDVSNPAIANLALRDARPGDRVLLPSESLPAYAYSHVERTFSEFRLSAYDQPGGAEGIGPFSPDAPANFRTSLPGNKIGRCQDCHMCSRWSVAANDPSAPVRPEGSEEHPDTWMPCHAMTGANIWVTSVLASIAPDPLDGSVPDPRNAELLMRGPDALTLDFTQGTWPTIPADPAFEHGRPSTTRGALNLAATRLRGVLRNAASITNLDYRPDSGDLSFRIQNQTAHKLISGFPEGRRMFVNIEVYSEDRLMYAVNPYDYEVGTLKGLPDSESSPRLAENEAYQDRLVYECHHSSAITGEKKTFHFVLATDRIKDNRIPPRGFRIAEAKARLSEPVYNGESAPEYFTKAEYEGGYDEVAVKLPGGATKIVVNLYYQTTSREYIEFLRDEIKGTGRLTLPKSAYVAQTDPFFAKLKAWGDTIFELWEHNKNVDGAKPFLMTQASWQAQ